MAYEDKFNKNLEIDILNEAQELIVQMFMKNGELLFRSTIVEFLEKDIHEYLSEVDWEPNQEWIDGVRYVIHLLKEGDFDAK